MLLDWFVFVYGLLMFKGFDVLVMVFELYDNFCVRDVDMLSFVVSD